MSEKRPILKLPLAIAFLAALLLWPVVGVSRPMPADFLTGPELAVYAMVFFAACIGYWEAIAALFAFNKEHLRFRLEVLAWCGYLSLFVTSCLLCRRLKVCVIHIHNLPAPVGAWIGPVVTLFGVLLLLSPLFLPPKKDVEKTALIAYPHFLGLLFIVTGVSIAHWAWFPLLALPGLLVVEAWYIRRKERAATDINAQTLPQARFKVLPFIY